MSSSPESWSRRFGAVALVNALIAIVWLLFPIAIDSRISRTIAGGSAGTWGFLGFLLFIIVGVLGFATFASLYYIIPKATGGTVNSVLAWLHLALLEVGTLAGTALLGYAGYIGGTTILDETAKGTAAKDIPGIVHGKISFVVEPISMFALVASLGVLLGVFGLFLMYWKSSREEDRRTETVQEPIVV
jgi:heme/copper-type cytochrome/quinol oxidase subunit 1